jgi:site-specific DNA-cytosine methylase
MSATKGLFGKYLNRVFIETGSNYGDGIQQALDEGFEIVYSIEIDPERYNHCQERFKDNPDIHLLLGDTVKVLGVLLRYIEEPVTFWLDAHKGNGKSPLLQELEIIRNHPVKTHTLLIDDLRDWKKEKCGFNTDILRHKITKINQAYQFYLEDGYVEKDVLVAKV